MKFLVSIFAFVSLLQAGQAFAAQEGSQPVVVAKLTEPGIFPGSKLDFRTEINEKYQFYDISGATADELRRQMSKNGTKWDDGRTYDALTTWEIKYRYNTTVENGRCYVSSAKTDVGIIFRYPRWTNAAGAPEALTSRWNTYMQHLRTHEIGHKDMAVNTAREINEGLNSMGSFNSCTDLEKAARTLAQEKLARLKDAQKEYDSTTRHGETQGAYFP